MNIEKGHATSFDGERHSLGAEKKAKDWSKNTRLVEKRERVKEVKFSYNYADTSENFHSVWNRKKKKASR